VLVADIVSLLAPVPGGVYVDCTVGLGGHAAALLAAGAGRVIAIDRDARALDVARRRLDAEGDRVEFVHADYRELMAILRERLIGPVAGVVVDCGVSSMQLDDPSRGFSFRAGGPLDMRMDSSRGPSLAERLAVVDEETLADVIPAVWGERDPAAWARHPAARDRGALDSTLALASAARRGVGAGRWQRIDPATRTFQALRIWVNGELDGLEAFVDAAVGALGPGGRLAIVAFHSLEDRVVKHAMRRLAAAGTVTLLTKRPVVPGGAEIAANPRARSARLRAVEKVA
jgi:16S rRNA (cytosine1402-N4)-methyltransferase